MLKNIDYKSVIIGSLSTLCIFLIMGAAAERNNLGNITVNSINVVDENGDPRVTLKSLQFGGFIAAVNSLGEVSTVFGVDEDGTGFVQTFNELGEQITHLGASSSNGGVVKTRNAQGVLTSYVGTSADGNGIIKTFNENEKMTAFFGTDKDQEGMLLLSDKNGDLNWGRFGKQEIKH